MGLFESLSKREEIASYSLSLPVSHNHVEIHNLFSPSNEDLLICGLLRQNAILQVRSSLFSKTPERGEKCLELLQRLWEYLWEL